VFYIHANDILPEIKDEIIRTNSCYFLVKDEKEQLVGCFTIEKLFEFLAL
jgi:hypothetical protein